MNKDTVTIDRELFEWLAEYALILRGCRSWLKNDEYKQMVQHIEQAVAIRDGVQKEGDE